MKSKVVTSILLILAILAAMCLSGNIPDLNFGKRPSPRNDGIKLQ